MNSFTKVYVPKESNNDEDMTIVSYNFKEGSKVNSNDVLAELEGSKSIIEVLSPVDGYIKYLYKTDSVVKVGDELLYIFKKSKDINTVVINNESTKNNYNSKGDNKKLTKFSKKANELIKKYNLDKNIFKDSQLIVERDIIELFFNNPS